MAPFSTKPGADPPDPARVAAWAEAVAEGRADELRAVFRAQSAKGPQIVWSPPAERLAPGPLRFLLDYWSGLAAGRAMPFARQVDPLDMRPALGYVLLLDVVDGGRDFRYRVFGTAVAAVSEFDMTGRCLSAFPASTYITEFYLACLRAVVRRAAPLFTSHAPPMTVQTAAWHRLVLPLEGEDGTIARCLTGAVPIDRDGRAINAHL